MFEKIGDDQESRNEKSQFLTSICEFKWHFIILKTLQKLVKQSQNNFFQIAITPSVENY